MDHYAISVDAAHYVEHMMPRSAVVKWLKEHHAGFTFTDSTSKTKLSRAFALQFLKVYQHELEATVEQAVARERARTKYEVWLTEVEHKIREGSLRSVRSYFSTNEGDYLTLDKRERYNTFDTCGPHI